MQRIIETVVLIVVCSALAYGSPRRKHESQTGCEAYINNRWAAFEDAIQTSRANYKRLQASGVISQLTYDDLKEQLPILTWKYSRRKSRNCRKTLTDRDTSNAPMLIDRANEMETESKNVSAVHWNAFWSQVFANVDHASQQTQEQNEELRKRAGCTDVVPGIDPDTGKDVPAIVDVPCSITGH